MLLWLRIKKNVKLLERDHFSFFPTNQQKSCMLQLENYHFCFFSLLLLASASLQSREFSPNKNDIPQPSSMWSVVEHGHEEGATKTQADKSQTAKKGRLPSPSKDEVTNSTTPAFKLLVARLTEYINEL